MHLRDVVAFRVDPSEAQTYVLEVAVGGTAGADVAVAGSDNTIKVYSMQSEGLRIAGRLTGHQGTIGALRFAANGLLWSAAEDGNAVGWDTRTMSPAVHVRSRSGASLLSLDASCNGSLVAAGTALKGDEATVAFWDTRNTSRSLAEFTECHMDDVTRIRFHSSQPNVVATAAEDGIINVFSLRPDMDEEESLDSVLNAGQMPSRVGFFGREGQYVFCATNVETLGVWRVAEADRIADYGDVRQRLAAANVLVDYIVDCEYDAQGDRLLILAGTYEGALRILHATTEDIVHVTDLPAGGHADRVRSMHWDTKNGVLITGGEDGRICTWTSSAPTPAAQEDRRRMVMTGTSASKAPRQYSPYAR